MKINMCVGARMNFPPPSPFQIEKTGYWSGGGGRDRLAGMEGKDR